jgi:hypothetical protein
MSRKYYQVEIGPSMALGIVRLHEKIIRELRSTCMPGCFRSAAPRSPQDWPVGDSCALLAGLRLGGLVPVSQDEGSVMVEGGPVLP